MRHQNFLPQRKYTRLSGNKNGGEARKTVIQDSREQEKNNHSEKCKTEQVMKTKGII